MRAHTQKVRGTEPPASPFCGRVEPIFAGLGLITTQPTSALASTRRESSGQLEVTKCDLKSERSVSIEQKLLSAGREELCSY